MDCSLPDFSVHGFSRQEYWSGLPYPPPRDLPDPGTEPTSLTSPHWHAGSLPPVPPGLETIKLLEENIGTTLFDINHSKTFSVLKKPFLK